MDDYCKKCLHIDKDTAQCQDCTEGDKFEHITGGLCNDCVRVNCPLAGHSDGTACEEYEVASGCEGSMCEICTEKTRKGCGV